ncbi:uncharacterized protein [Acropora muricata]|uniref:uncharacterized protein n=1 Tax=Acropora muricata TaxID=159855 RepID=UPI0034E3DCFD
MLDQTSLLRNLLAFMLFLHLASTNLASAKSVCKCENEEEDFPSKKVVDYNVRINEYGEQYSETIEVDTEKQTELFKVPAHKNVDQSNILHDFKMNMSLLLLPEKKVCYLLPLEKDLSTPRKLLSDLDRAEKSEMRISEATINEHKWTAGSEVTDRSVLSDELANFCAKYPIYYVEKIKDSMTATRIQKHGGKNEKRQIYSCRNRCYQDRTCYTTTSCFLFICSTEHIISTVTRCVCI